MAKNRNAKTTNKSKKIPRGRRKGTRISVHAPDVISALAERLSLTGTLLTYQDVADVLTAKTGLRVTRPTVWRLARELKDGTVPPHNTNRLRAALGLPCYAPAPVCPKHGVVHQGQCPKKTKPPKSLHYWPVRQLARAIRERKEMG